jgi:hypothetical protein
VCARSGCVGPTRTRAASGAASQPEPDALQALEAKLKAGITAEVKAEVKAQLRSAGLLPFSTRALAETYRDASRTHLLQHAPLPAWFAPHPLAPPAHVWTPLPPGASRAEVRALFERAAAALAAASRAPTLVLEAFPHSSSSAVPIMSIGTSEPDMLGYVAAAPAAPAAAAAAAQPLSRSLTHVACVGVLTPRRAAGDEGAFTDAEAGAALHCAHELARAQPWRGARARVVSFLCDGAHVVFFECTFCVDVDASTPRARALRVTLRAAAQSAPLPLAGAGGAHLAGLSAAPLAALGAALPRCAVRGAPVALQAYLGAGATSLGFAATWRGEAVVLKRYHAWTATDVVQCERAALRAAAGAHGVCALRAHADADDDAGGGLLLAPRGVVAYSLRAAPSDDDDDDDAPPSAPALASLWRPDDAAPAAPEAPLAPLAPAAPRRPRAAEFCDAVDALASLHAAGWVHRDPRPANFFRDAAGRFFLADLGSAAPWRDDASYDRDSYDAASDTRPWAPQYGPLAALRAASDGAPPPPPSPSHDFEQLARLVYAAAAREADTLPTRGDTRALVAWWERRDAASMLLAALLPAAAAAAGGGDAARRALKACIRAVLVT